MKLKCAFVKLSQDIAERTGSPVTFIAACAVVFVWAVSGPFFHFSETWQLVINTGTTIITFLMVFLIQSTQNRDTAALHLKLNELIRAKEGAHLALLDIEKLDEEEFQAYRLMYNKIAEEARKRMDEGESDADCPEIEMNPLELLNEKIAA